MVKLASAREYRTYGPRLARNRSEYMNAGLYVFATILLLGGFTAQLSYEPKSGLVLLLIGFAAVLVVNVHDLVAHLAPIDYRILQLVECDMQLGLVEFAVPVVNVLGTLLFFIGTLFVFIQAEKGHGYYKLGRPAFYMLTAAPFLWMLGSVHNACQIYERADGHVQILQASILIPLLTSSLLFVVGAVLNSREQVGHNHRGLELLGGLWIWLGIFGSLILFVGALANVVKVFKMQQHSGLRLEKLRGGAQEWLVRMREGQMPLLIEEEQPRQRPRPTYMPIEEGGSTSTSPAPAPALAPTPYKDVLVGEA